MENYLNWEEKDRLLVNVGGSHRQYKRVIDLFKKEGIPFSSSGCSSLGSRRQAWVIPDTEHARTILKQAKGSVAQKQWEHLKANKNEPEFNPYPEDEFP